MQAKYSQTDARDESGGRKSLFWIIFLNFVLASHLFKCLRTSSWISLSMLLSLKCQFIYLSAFKDLRLKSAPLNSLSFPCFRWELMTLCIYATNSHVPWLSDSHCALRSTSLCSHFVLLVPSMAKGMLGSKSMQQVKKIICLCSGFMLYLLSTLPEYLPLTGPPPV